MLAAVDTLSFFLEFARQPELLDLRCTSCELENGATSGVQASHKTEETGFCACHLVVIAPAQRSEWVARAVAMASFLA